MIEHVPGGPLELQRSVGVLGGLPQLLLGDDLVPEGAKESVVAVQRVELVAERLQRAELLGVRLAGPGRGEDGRGRPALAPAVRLVGQRTGVLSLCRLARQVLEELGAVLEASVSTGGRPSSFAPASMTAVNGEATVPTTSPMKSNSPIRTPAAGSSSASPTLHGWCRGAPDEGLGAGIQLMGRPSATADAGVATARVGA